MKTKAILFSILLVTAEAATSATFMLAGVVPDRGFTLNGQNINQQSGSGLKVYISEHKVERGPQSVGVVGQTAKKWKKLKGTETLTAESCVRVEAP